MKVRNKEKEKNVEKERGEKEILALSYEKLSKIYEL